MTRHRAGFTLLELLIAIAIFSLLASGCYRLFRSVSQTQELTAALWQRTGDVQRAMLLLQKDFAQLARRPIRNEFGDREAAIVAGAGRSVTFTRAGWRNFTGAARSDLQRVRYQLDGGRLLRRYWPTLDRAPETPYRQQLVIDDLQDLRLRFRDDKKRWHQSWPPTSDKQNERQVLLPSAIEVTLVHARLGEIQQLIDGTTYKPENKKPTAEGGRGGDPRRAGDEWGNRPRPAGPAPIYQGEGGIE